MADEIILRDQNFVTVLAGVTDDVDQDITMFRVNPISKRLLVKADISGGFVSSVNGLTGAVVLAAGTGITLGTVGNTITINAPDVGTVTSVSGTTNRITVTNPTTTPVIDIAATYVGQTSLITLGTISTGIWQGTSISTTYTDAKIKTVTGTANRLTVGGTATDPTFDISTSYVGQATITTLGTIVTGIWNGTKVSEVYGGTNQSSYALGDTLYASASNTLSKLTGNITTTKKFLRQTGDGVNSTAPAWDTIIASDIPTANLVGTANQVILSASGTGVLVGSTSITLSLPQSIATSSTPQFAAIEMGNASDTTIARVSAGIISVEGVTVVDVSTAQELTNKTLTSSVAKGTWTASGTWTIPAVTLGGTVSGGGNNINNVIVGVTTPLAGTFTTLTANTSLRILEGGSSPSKFTIFQGGDQSVDVTYTLPTGQASGTQVLQNDGTGVLSWATSSGGTVTSVSGTANRITSTGGATPVIDISASYVGQTSITTLGTISTGTWNATKIGLAYGGTNQDFSATGGPGKFLKQAIAAGAITVTQVAAADLSDGTTGTGLVVLGTAPAFTTSITTPIMQSNTTGVAGSGVIRLANAELIAWDSSPTGTDLTIKMDSSNVFTSSVPINATTGFRIGGAAAGGKILRGSGVNFIASTGTYPDTTSQGDVLISTADAAYSNLPKNTTATRYLANTGSSNSPAWDRINLLNGVTEALPIANGGTNSATTLNNSRVMVSSGGAIIESGAITDGESIQRNNTSFISAPLPLSTVEGRLTLTSVTPVTTTDVTGATTIYFTPYRGDRISIYDGTRWKAYSFSEVSLALGTLVNAQAYDVFMYDSSGTLTLETAEWKNATITMTIATPCVVTWTAHGMSSGQSITFTNSGGALPTGVTANTQYWVTVVDANTFKLSTTQANQAAGTFINTTGSQSGTHTGHNPQLRQTALVLQNGVLVKSGATTRRYLGTFMTTSTTATADSVANRFVWNYYNRVSRQMNVTDTTASWTYGTNAWRQANAAVANKVSVFVGYDEDLFYMLAVSNENNASTAWGNVGIGIDSTVTNSSTLYTNNQGSVLASNNASYTGHLGIGYHTILWLEKAQSTFTITYYGSSSTGTNDGKPGLNGNFLM